MKIAWSQVLADSNICIHEFIFYFSSAMCIFLGFSQEGKKSRLFREQQSSHYPDMYIRSWLKIWNDMRQSTRSHTVCVPSKTIKWRWMMDLYLMFKQSNSQIFDEINCFWISSWLLVEMTRGEKIQDSTKHYEFKCMPLLHSERRLNFYHFDSKIIKTRPFWLR